MSNRYTIVTGAGGSIGRAITRTLASEGRNIIMACRNVTKDAPLCKQIDDECNGHVRIMQLDLASFDSIRSCAHLIEQEDIVVEALINNAGVMNKHYATTADNHEMTIGVNFLGTYLLTLLLLPRIADGGNITFTTSLTRYIGKIERNFYDNDASHYTRFDAYSKSKLATTLLTAHLAEQLAPRNIHVNAADPGVVDSNMIHMDSWVDGIADALFRPIISTPQQGAMSALSATKSQLTGMIFTQNKHHDIPQRYRNHPLKEWLLHKAKAIITARKE